MGTIVKGKTSKQRHRKASRRKQLRENAAVKRYAKKAGTLKHQGKRRTNTREVADSSSRTAEQLVAEVDSGTVRATLDALDPRSLVDMMKKRVNVAPGKPVKVASSSSSSSPAASPSTPAVGQSKRAQREAQEAAERFARQAADNIGERRKWTLSTEAAATVAPDPMAKINEELDAAERQNFNPNERKNQNQYARRGPAMGFWGRVDVHPLLQAALRDLKFTHPTPIQQETMPSTMCVTPAAASQNPHFRPADSSKDVVVSAETGSGKTLTFALPILQRILLNIGDDVLMAEDEEDQAQQQQQQRAPGKKAARGMDDDDEGEEEEEEVPLDEVEEGEEQEEDDDAELAVGEGEEIELYEEDEDEMDDGDLAFGGEARQQKVLHSLILTPTRELALQISESMRQLTTHCRRHVRIACIVGGMAPAKQQRLLNQCPDVLIATPGRAWDLTQKNEGAFLGHSISRRLSCLVLDEADRLIESGKFEELQQILERVRCDVLPRGQGDNDDGEEVQGALQEGVWDEDKQEFVAAARPAASKKDEPKRMPMPPPPEPGHRTITFVTSATLSLQVNFQNKNKKEKKILRTKNADTMQLVMNDLGLHKKSSVVFNLAPEAQVVSKLQEAYLRCPDGSKELYLFYFLRQYARTGLTVVFVNAISMLRRLVKIFEVLRIECVGLHASMQQRQRLKVIDKFKSGAKPVLIATDVAARGLDVDGVRYIVHYQLPRSTDAYIHRCGRTARCGGDGFSCVFLDPDEYNPFKQLMQSMGRSAKLELLSLDQSIVHRLVPQHKLALQIDLLSREVRKKGAEHGWVDRMARDADLDAGDMTIDRDTKQELNEKGKAARMLRKRLDALLMQDTGRKGGFLSSARTIGASEAASKVQTRAARQIRMHRTE